ncbi:rCG50947 [Rattus norvegicus]|uniref:RCG50947 n=1 Tax=Rattus norvegicus TaxID=10116 RepID=A6KGC6_RAT|nr:rCG50947 [Rattus norvegicus]
MEAQLKRFQRGKLLATELQALVIFGQKNLMALSFDLNLPKGKIKVTE